MGTELKNASHQPASTVESVDKIYAPEQRRLLSFEEIRGKVIAYFKHEDYQPRTLEEGIQKWFDAIFLKLNCRTVNLEDADLGIIDIMYTLFRMGHDKKYKSYALTRYFRGFYPMKRRFFPNATHQMCVALQKYIQQYVEQVIHPKEHITVRDEKKHRGYYPWTEPQRIYAQTHEWRLLPALTKKDEWTEDIHDYASRSVVIEALRLRMRGYTSPEYTHVSSSDALLGIEQAGALQSSGIVQARGGRVNSGEHKHWHYKGFKTRRGLRDVYVSPEDSLPYYHKLNWFNSYPVAFGIDRRTHEMQQRSDGFSYVDYDGKPTGKLVENLGSDGVVIGPEVKLTAVKYVYCWNKNKVRMESWVKEHAPQAKVISYEAVELLKKYTPRSVHKITTALGITEAQMWVKIANGTLDYKPR